MQVRNDPSVERTVTALVAQLGPLEVLGPDRDTSLADLGYDSLACAELAAAVEERLGVRLADSEVEQLRTLGDVVEAVERRGGGVALRLDRLGRGQDVGELLAGWAFRGYCRLRVVGAERIPRTGPVILAANHRSMLDVPLMVLASPRRMVFMAKKELFGDPFRAWLWDWLGGFPVRRDISDIRALDVALSMLQRGHCLALYPEGRRSRSGEMLPFLKGAAWLALRTGATIVPCGIRGTQSRRGWRKLLPKRVRVSFGEAVPVEKQDDVRVRRAMAAEITARLSEGVHALMA